MIHLLNGIAEPWLRYMASATLQATLLAIFLLGALRIGRRLPPALRYATLMLALCKFVFPPMLSLPTGLFNRIDPQQWRSTSPQRYVAPAVQTAFRPALTRSRRGASLPALPMNTSPATSAPLSPKGKLLLLHIAGALLIFALILLQRLRLRRLVLNAAPPRDALLADTYGELCRIMHLPAPPRLLLSAENHAPVTFGVLDPVVMLPEKLVAELPLPAIRVVLGHELAHHRRYDPWLVWLQAMISALWWFNPVYWLLSRNLRSVREDCCDDTVVASGIATRESYCTTLLQAARATLRNPIRGVALAYLGESGPLQRRFKRIMTAKSIRMPKLAGLGTLAIALLALLLLPGVRPRVLADTSSRVESTVKKLNESTPLSSIETPRVAENFLNRPGKMVGNSETAGVLPEQQTETALQERPKDPGYIVGEVPPAYLKWLTEDVDYIITAQERREFLECRTDEQRDSFIEQFWARRDPSNGAQGSFKQEHYRRLAYANEHFSSSLPGWKTDRGRIYILYGKPDEIESHPKGVTYGSMTTCPFEKWKYRSIPGVGSDIEIEFIDPSGTGEYRTATYPEEKNSRANSASGIIYYDLKMDRASQELWNLVLRINTKDLEFIRQQGSNRAECRVFGKITDLSGRTLWEWEDVISAEYPDSLFEAGRNKQTEYTKIFKLPSDMFNVDVEVKDVNSNRTGRRMATFPVPGPAVGNVFERMGEYFRLAGSTGRVR